MANNAKKTTSTPAAFQQCCIITQKHMNKMHIAIKHRNVELMSEILLFIVMRGMEADSAAR